MIKRIGIGFGRLIKTILFIALALLVFLLLWRTLGYQDDTHTRGSFGAFYDYEPNSLDAIFIGGSNVQTAFAPSVIYEKSGISSANLATSSQPFFMEKYVVQMAEELQDPVVYIVDIRMLIYEIQNDGKFAVNEANVRRVTDNMLPSPARYFAIEQALVELDKTKANDFEKDPWEYHFSYQTYHNRWDSLNDIDFYQDKESYLGFYYYSNCEDFSTDPYADFHKDIKVSKLPGENERYLQEFISYCKRNDIDVLFTNLPSNLNDENNAYLDLAMKEVRAAGYTCLDFDGELDKEIGFDWGTDCNEGMHVNYKGAMKISDYMADYLKANYTFSGTTSEKNKSIYNKTQKRLKEDLSNAVITVNTNE